MIITVIGAGVIGSAVTYALSQMDDIEQIHVCDARPGTLQALREWLPSRKIIPHQIDARHIHAIKPLLRNASCLVSCVRSTLNPPLVQLAVSEGVHYCDMGGQRRIIQEELSWHETAKERGVWVIPNCGLAPGLINILLMHGVDQFDHVNEAKLRVGNIPLKPNPPLNVGSFFSAEKLVEDYGAPAIKISDNKIQEVDSLTEIETITFEEPFGVLEAFQTSGVLENLPDNITEKVDNLDYKTVHYPYHALQMRFVLALGLAEKRLIDISTHLTYRDILIRKIRQRMQIDLPDAVLLRVSITGEKEGKNQTLTYAMTETFKDDNRLTALKRCTGFSAATVAYLLASGQVNGAGAMPPEQCIPKRTFFDIYQEKGFEFSVNWS